MGAMPFQSHIFDNADAALGAARSMLAAYSAAGEEPTLLAPTPTAALRVRRALSEDPSAFGSRVETPASWIADRWELFGDGRCLVNEAERELLVSRALVETADAAARPGSTPGVIDLASKLAREALPRIAAVDVPLQVC